MDDASEDAVRVLDGLEIRVRRLIALVAAARDMTSVVSSKDQSLEHAQELLAIADELSPGITADMESLASRLKSFSLIAAPTRAA